MVRNGLIKLEPSKDKPKELIEVQRVPFLLFFSKQSRCSGYSVWSDPNRRERFVWEVFWIEVRRWNSQDEKRYLRFWPKREDRGLIPSRLLVPEILHCTVFSLGTNRRLVDTLTLIHWTRRVRSHRNHYYYRWVPSTVLKTRIGDLIHRTLPFQRGTQRMTT